MKTYSLKSFNGGLITSPKNTYAFTSITFKNGIKTVLKPAEGAKIIFILEGELDLVIDKSHFRLKKGYWMNIPKDCLYGVEVYRSVVPCEFIVLTCLQGAFESKIQVGDLEALPLKRDTVKYAMFAQESEVMQGAYLSFSNSDEIWEDTTINEGFVFALEGDYAVKSFFSETILPQGFMMFLPKKKKFTVKPLKGRGKVIVVTSPAHGGKSYEYEDFLKEKYGINWKEGILYL